MKKYRDIKEKVASKLKIAREMAGLSQGQVAKMIGLHRPSISEIEAGRRRVSADELSRLAEIYGISISWLTSVEEENVNEARISLAAREISKLKSQDLDHLLQLIKALRSSIEEDTDE